MSKLMDSFRNDSGLENSWELLQQIALQHYVKNGEDSKGFYNAVTTFRIGNEIFQRMSGRRKVQKCKEECIRNISDYINANPSASKSDLSSYMQAQIALFSAKISA